MVFCLFEIQKVMPQQILDLLASWQDRIGQHWNVSI